MSVKGPSDHAGPQCALHLVEGWQGPWRNEGESSWVVEAPRHAPHASAGSTCSGEGSGQGGCWLSSGGGGPGCRFAAALVPSPISRNAGMAQRVSRWTQVPEHQVHLGHGQSGPYRQAQQLSGCQAGWPDRKPHRDHSRSRGQRLGRRWPRGTWKASWMKARRMGLERKSRAKGRVCATGAGGSSRSDGAGAPAGAL